MQTIKTINNFTTAVHTALAAAFPECRIEAASVTKNNGVHFTGLTVRPQSQRIAPTIYMDPYFDMLQSGEPFETVIDQIVSCCTAALSCAQNGIDAGDITDFTQLKDKICYKLVSRDLNRELLSAVPHRDYHDLAVIYYIRLCMTDNGMATITVTDNLARIWGADEETLYNLACTNTPVLNRGCVMPVLDVLDSLCDVKETAARESSTYDNFDFTYTGKSELPMYVATNKNKIYGAGILLYAGLLDAVAGKLGNFYVLPSSVHELIIIPDTFGNPSELKQMVKNINGTEVQAEEILSDNCYHYDAGTHEFKIAA